MRAANVTRKTSGRKFTVLVEITGEPTTLDARELASYVAESINTWQGSFSPEERLVQSVRVVYCKELR